jgi:hypothetical protein
MLDLAPAPAACDPDNGRDNGPGEILRRVVDVLQLASCGSAALDAMVSAALAQVISSAADVAAGRRWSSDISDALQLVSLTHNFSLGRRDGVCWAWIQPNDSWQPSDMEARHDHPLGSGLIVAETPVLALLSAALLLEARHIERK